ncbi:NADPH oxidase 5-like isoform X1 [Mytilus galloprovincialis]|uniref:NADPH oxidase 5-like isoform X1 n=1 Tax=Mytilus galloprovincialis TaxID=29158 RepID=UPI003F7CA287
MKEVPKLCVQYFISKMKSVNYKPIDEDNDDSSDESEDERWVKLVNKEFQKFAENGRLCTENFKKALRLKKSFFGERFFALFDTDGSGDIECEELINGLRMLKNGTPTQKLKFLFDVFDADGSGTVDKYEMRMVLKSCTEESSLTLCNEDIDELTSVLFEDADVDNSGEITFDEFQSSLEKHPGLIDDMTLSATHWFDIRKSNTCSQGARYCSKVYWEHNTSKIVFIILYVIANLGLGAFAGWNHNKSNGFLITARVCGMNLNFNCTLVLVLMLRQTINLVRSTRIGRYLPLDEHSVFHQFVGAMIGVYAVFHTIGHIGNAILLSNDGVALLAWRILLTDITTFGLINGTAFITGWILLVILLIMCVLSYPSVRSRIYQVFFYLHFLCIPFWILLIIHCKHFWMWILVPGTIFLIEQIYRVKWIKQLRYGVTYIEKVTLLPCGVTHLEISRPKTFDFQPGDYMYLQIPDISPYEFHPFTISSAPEMKDRLWLHVRTTGNWTKDLYQYLSRYDPGEECEVEAETPMMTTLQMKRKEQQPNRRKSIIDRLNGLMTNIRRRGTIGSLDGEEIARLKRIKMKIKSVKIRCFLDGPFGTASREALTTEHAILIGAGIGVTPMASILQSIIHQIKRNKRKCPKCTHCWYDDNQENMLKMKKVDFIWINRDQRCFEWFVRVLNNLEVEQSLAGWEEDKFVDLHLYMTSAVKKTHMEGVGLQLALDLVHKKERKDFFTGLKTKTQAGRPDWDKLFGKFSGQNKGKKKVFFCGPKLMSDTLKKVCEKYSFAFAKENF